MWGLINYYKNHYFISHKKIFSGYFHKYLIKLFRKNKTVMFHMKKLENFRLF